MNKLKKSKKAGAIIGIAIITLAFLGVIISGVFESSIAVKTFPNEHLFIDETIPLKTNETNETVDVSCILYITNIWEKESGKLKATAYVVETVNNFALYEEEIDIGNIKSNSTKKVSIPVVLSNNSYKIKILLFENEKLIIKGELIISAYPIYDWEEINRGNVDCQEWYLHNSGIKIEQIR